MPELANKFMVGVRGDEIVFLKPLWPKMSKLDALVLAAWLVAMAEDKPGEFEEIRTAVNNL